MNRSKSMKSMKFLLICTIVMGMISSCRFQLNTLPPTSPTETPTFTLPPDVIASPTIAFDTAAPAPANEIVSAESCTSTNGPAPVLIDPRPAAGLDTVGRIDRTLGGGMVQSREFTIELFLYCHPGYGPNSMEPYFLSDIGGLAIYYKWRYDGMTRNGNTYVFNGIVPEIQGHIEEEESLNQGQMNPPGTNAMGVHFTGDTLPDFSQKVPVRFIYILQGPSGQLSGAALSFDLQRVADGIQPSNVFTTALSDTELEAFKSILPSVAP